MEKQGIIAPHTTPPEDGDTAKTAASITQPCETTEAGREIVRQLDSDFRKAAAEATKKSLR
jgi:hypothetical protein